MDSQSSFIRRFILWGLAWILILSLLAGLVLWKAPLGAARDSTASVFTASPVLETTPASSYPLFFPLLFKNGQPSSPAVP